MAVANSVGFLASFSSHFAPFYLLSNFDETLRNMAFPRNELSDRIQSDDKQPLVIRPA